MCIDAIRYHATPYGVASIIELRCAPTGEKRKSVGAAAETHHQRTQHDLACLSVVGVSHLARDGWIGHLPATIHF